jgi:hypothetical protein
LRLAREASDSLWPEVVHLSSQHPLVEWLTDKVLANLGRNEAPVLVAGGHVDSPTFLVQGMYSNVAGQATVVEWMAIDRLPASPSVRQLTAELLGELGVGPAMPNPAEPGAATVAGLTELVPAAVDAGRAHMKAVKAERSAAVGERLRAHWRRLDRWKTESTALIEAMGATPQRRRREDEVAAIAESTNRLIESFETKGEPLVRVVAVIVGQR